MNDNIPVKKVVGPATKHLFEWIGKSENHGKDIYES